MTAQLEVWRNTGRGLLIVKKLSHDGSVRDEPVYGGSEFRVTAEERRTHSARCKTANLDPYRNGLCEPLNEEAVAAASEVVTRTGSVWSNIENTQATNTAPAGSGGLSDDERVELAQLRAEKAAREAPPAAPSYQVLDGGELRDVAPVNATPTPPAPVLPANMVSEDDRIAVLTGNGNKAKALLARIDSPVVLDQLLARAKGGESTPARVKMIEARSVEVDPHFKPVRTGIRHSDTGLVAPGPQDLDVDATDPQSFGASVDDPNGDGPVGDIDDDGTVFVPGEGVEPDDDGPVLTVPGGVPDGQPRPQKPNFAGYVEPD